MGERTDTTLTVSVPPYMSGRQIHVWIAFLSADGIESSLSSYAGSIEIA
ncbi:DUF6266 family protein [Epilithonimonas mollis]